MTLLVMNFKFWYIYIYIDRFSETKTEHNIVKQNRTERKREKHIKNNEQKEIKRTRRRKLIKLK